MAGILSAAILFGHAGDLEEIVNSGGIIPPTYVPTYYLIGF